LPEKWLWLSEGGRNYLRLTGRVVLSITVKISGVTSMERGNHGIFTRFCWWWWCFASKAGELIEIEKCKVGE
jgi:hypothetical protein